MNRNRYWNDNLNNYKSIVLTDLFYFSIIFTKNISYLLFNDFFLEFTEYNPFISQKYNKIPQFFSFTTQTGRYKNLVFVKKTTFKVHTAFLHGQGCPVF